MLSSSSATTTSSHDKDDSTTAQRSTTGRKPIPRWITCSSSKELIHAIEAIVQPDDKVAELGSQLRDVSTAICKKLDAERSTPGFATLVDVRRNFPRKAATSTEKTRTGAMRMPGHQDSFFNDVSQFIEIDSLDDWRRAFLDSNNSKNDDDGVVVSPVAYTVLVLDVNAIVGNDLEWTSLAIIREFVALFPSCQSVLVKSESLNKWATRIVHGKHWIAGIVDGPTMRASENEDATIISPKIIATVGVEQYRQTIERTVQPGDAALEVGCHLGTTTRLLHTAVHTDSDSADGYAIGVDCGSKIVRGAVARYPDIFFSVGDAWKTADLLRIQQRFQGQDRVSSRNGRIGFDVIYVDVGGLSGNDGLLEALSLISALMNALEPRCLVIKSLCIQRLSSTMTPYWRLQAARKQ